MKNDSLNIPRRIGKSNENIDATNENLPDSPDTSSTENMSASAENVSGKTVSTEKLHAGQEPSHAYGGRPYTPSSNIHAQEGLVREPDPAYNYGTGARKATGGKTPGRLYTLEDYLALPDDRRVELIDGVIYDMAAPSRLHQKIIGRIWRMLEDCIEEKGLSCDALFAPYDVILDAHTVVQPDIMVFCGDDPETRNLRATHAPDLVIEVLSPSTASRDRFLKLQKYRESGVKELWLVSPNSRHVEVYLFSEGEDSPRRYSFSDKVPVHISEDLPEGKCEVDFSAVTHGLPLP